MISAENDRNYSYDQVEVVYVPEILSILCVLELFRDERCEEGAETKEEVHGVHVRRGLPPPPDVQEQHVGRGVESSIKQTEDEGVDTHRQH